MDERIERYLDGGMTSAEAAAFLREVRDDPEALALLGRALEQQADLFDALQPVQATRARRPRSRRTNPTPSPGWVGGAVAAAAAILLVLAAANSGKPLRLQPGPVVVREDEPSFAPPEPPAPVREKRTAPTEPSSPSPRTPRPAPPPEPAPDPGPTPVPPTPPPPVAPPRETVPAPRPAIARLDQVSGSVTLAGAGVGRGQALADGDTVEVGGPDGAATVAYEDGTRLDVRPGSVLRLEEGPAKRVILRGGAVSARVERQARPMLFVTPHVEVAVLGTRLILSVGAESSHVEVREGRVRMTRLSDRSWVDVRAGFQATAVRGKDLSARPLPIEEILLVPAQASIAGQDWRAVRDPAASTGIALEAPRLHRQLLQNYADAPRVTFTFRAEADREYHLWVRGRTTAPRDVMEHDALIVEIPGATLTEPPGPNRGLTGSPERALVNGFMHRAGYWWVGGDADGGGDATPVTVRFARAGVQTLRLFTYESPVRIDALWLTSTQKSRPDPDRTGPR